MITLYYGSKKAMKEALMGTKENPKVTPVSAMRYGETSMFGIEVTENCKVCGSNRPSITHVMVTNAKGQRKLATEFYAEITVEKGVIKKIS